MKVAIEEKMFAKTTISSILVTLFFQKPLMEEVSMAISSKSLTLGLRTTASTMPANHPAARRGLSEVIGAMMKAVSMLKGWPKASRVPKALKVPFQSIQDFICSKPVSLLVNKV